MVESTKERDNEERVNVLKDALIHFTLEVFPTLLNCSRKNLESTLNSKTNEAFLKRFIIDQNTRLFIVRKEVAAESGCVNSSNSTREVNYENRHIEGKNESAEYSLKVSCDLTTEMLHADISVFLLKKANVNFLEEGVSTVDEKNDLSNSRFIASRISVMNFGGIMGVDQSPESTELKSLSCPTNVEELLSANSLFDEIMNYLQCIVSPVLQTHMLSSDVSDDMAVNAQNDERDVMLTTRINLDEARRKLTELLVAMQQVQENSQVPVVHLYVDNVLKEYVHKLTIKNSKFVPEDFLQYLGDKSTSFITQAQVRVQKWNKEVQKILRLDRDIKSGSSVKEIQFWVNMEDSLRQIAQQLQLPEVDATFALLKYADNFANTLSFEKNTGLKNKLEAVANINILMRDFPINGLLSARSLTELIEPLQQIFKHLKKFKQVNHYPLERLFQFVEAISRDLNKQLHSILRTQRLMTIDFDEFESILSNCQKIHRVWEDGSRDFKDMIRSLMKRKTIISVFHPKLQCAHTVLLNRIESIRSVRSQHQKLKDVVNGLMRHEHWCDSHYTRAITSAYTVFQDIDALDTSPIGCETFEEAKKKYLDKIDKVETEISNTLRERLGATKTGMEMFRVFSQYNPLFFRPRIQDAIQQYQSKLIKQVNEEVKRLRIQFSNTYESSSSAIISNVLDIPNICGKFIWYKQLERKLKECLQRMEDVLGKSWEQHADGRNLKLIGNDFLKKLNSQNIFDQWISEIRDIKDCDYQSKIVFNIRKLNMNEYTIVLNYDPTIMFYFKEARHFTNLGIHVPYSVKFSAQDFQWIYPYLIKLEECCNTFMFTCRRLQLHTSEFLSQLVAHYQLEVYDLLNEGFTITWGSENLGVFTTSLSEKVYTFEEKLEELEAYVQKIKDIIASLTTASFDNNAVLFSKGHEEIQGILSQMAFQNYVSLDQYTEEINKQFETMLLVRLDNLIVAWVSEFVDWPVYGSSFIKTGSLHAFTFQADLLSFHPPVEAARQMWMSHLYNTIGYLCNLPHFTSCVGYNCLNSNESPKNVTLNKKKKTFFSLVQRSTKLPHALATIEKVINQLSGYVETWCKYQSLWKIELSTLINKMGNSIPLWKKFLHELQSYKKAFDMSDERKRFGPIIVDYSTAQIKVIRKFESYHHELVNSFGKRLFELISQILKELRHQIEMLEGQEDWSKILSSSMEESTYDADEMSMLSKVNKFVLQLREAKKKKEEWSHTIPDLESSEKILQKHYYTFPSNWLWVAGVINEYEKFSQILKHFTSLFGANFNFFKDFVLKQTVACEEHLTELYAEWAEERPLQGGITSQTAFSIISRFDSRIKLLREEYDKVLEVKESLDCDTQSSSTMASIYKNSFLSDGCFKLTPDVIETEIDNLRGVWTEFSKLHKELDTLKEMQWTATSPTKIRNSINLLNDTLKKVPAKYRQYEIFEHLKQTLQEYSNVNKIITSLSTDALKDRHWKMLVNLLGLHSTALNKISVGDLLNAGLEQHKNKIDEILAQAQGELALEEFISTLRQTWMSYEFNLYLYKNRCKLIREWDQLFSLLDDHLSSLQSMKSSPYYAVFQDEASSWDDRLSRVRQLVESWIEVQRKWVYLEGVFTESQDIQSLLPKEYSRFCSIDNDFLSIMKKTAQRPKLIELISSEGLQRSLDRLSELLSKIQKALGDYLERQRTVFPRFYFVGDEDLLEMIGNSKNIKLVQRHCVKIFAGISSFVTEVNNPHIITAMVSREGEVVEFVTPVNINDHMSLNAWLKVCESEMVTTLAVGLEKALKRLSSFMQNYEHKEFPDWIKTVPCQILLLCMQIEWTGLCTAVLRSAEKDSRLTHVLDRCVVLLKILSNRVIYESDKLCRLKLLQLITEVIHQREITTFLLTSDTSKLTDFSWLRCMRFYYNSNTKNISDRVSIEMANASFVYGFEYLGVSEKLVQTPLTDKCFLILTQALHLRLGGNPFGPAGTGKTETVKALGQLFGRFVLVFCCDESFDFQAMGRIFVGLCQVGAWGCFDEFNRLEERILSACSEQILTIQTGLKKNKQEVELLNKSVRLNPNINIFVTMNPGYAGRSNLPDNLKQLFREIAMVNPDKVQITEVLLYSHGFQSAKELSGKVVAVFDLCLQQLSKQPHYDFGLRSLKNVLSSAGILKRQSQNNVKDEMDNLLLVEKNILIQSICNNIVPKLVAEDIPLLRNLLQSVFPNTDLCSIQDLLLEEEIRRLCNVYHYLCVPAWLEKVLQLNQMQKLYHGIMLVGSVGTGKTAVWTTLLGAMEYLDGIKGQPYVLDPKSFTKEKLYGRLDTTTSEWTDGIFTFILRKIIKNVQGGSNKRYWIIFDGDVDPDWAENLNSVLDDNALLTLPNGERLEVPDSVRIIFEVDDLRCATLATVSRCGMVWFNSDVLPDSAITEHFLNKMRCAEETYLGGQQAPDGLQFILSRSATQNVEAFDGSADKILKRQATSTSHNREEEEIDSDATEAISRDFDSSLLMTSQSLTSQKFPTSRLGVDTKQTNVRLLAIEILAPFFQADEFVLKCIYEASLLPHIMDFTKIRAIETIFCLLDKFIHQLVAHCEYHEQYDMTYLEKYVTHILLFCVFWGCGGSMTNSNSGDFFKKISSLCTLISLPLSMSDNESLLDYYVNIEDGEWCNWKNSISPSHIDALQSQDVNLVVETVDTLRHRHVLSALVDQKRSFILCGPPGSGKTMTLTSTLKSLGCLDIAFLNFSSGTTSEVLLKTFDHYCEYVKTVSGMVLRPSEPGKWLIIFADEINLPMPDNYHTQRVIMFIRSIQQTGGFWKLIDSSLGHWCWVKVERVQFAGACNPPTDAGRHPLSNRFLRHTPVLFVDFPGADSLKQIYGTFNKALLSGLPQLTNYGDCLTNAMIEFYIASQRKFTTYQQPHYIYSPRELTRWKMSLFEALKKRSDIEIREFIRLVLHEGLRIFSDRLVSEEERLWTDNTINEILMKNFPCCDESMLTRPILFSNDLSQCYSEISSEDLKNLIESRLKTFNEEELNVQLIVFQELLEHITRISRVLQQPLGHLLLVGASGVGKTVVSKFVSWMNGLSIYQIKAGRNYNTAAFEADLRTVMKRAGIHEERITFIFSESNALGPAFIERMNALLANGEVPGLFEGDELTQLISEIKQTSPDIGQEGNDLFAEFTRKVQKNLHIIFIMNPANPEFSTCQASSPALFNRCVIDWFGNWSNSAFFQVAYNLIRHVSFPETKEAVTAESSNPYEVVAKTTVDIHTSVTSLNVLLKKIGKKSISMTPRDFLDFIQHFTKLIKEKEDERTDNVRHLSVGLAKLKDTELKVEELQESLAVKDVELQKINVQAEEKMQLIVKQQAVAEDRKREAETLAADLDNKASLMNKRRLEVGDELKLVEPLLREAESAVSNIPKRNLDELRAMANPPQMVKFAVEAVVVMLNNLGNNPTSWEECRKAIKSSDFITRVVTFDSMDTSPVTVQRVKQKYLDTDNWDVDKIMRASKAAGPLAIWVQSSIDFRLIVQKVDPLRDEIAALEKESLFNTEALKQTQTQILDLEKTLQDYKKDYAQLIVEVQMIKQEMEAVQHKVKRSTELLRNLGSEKLRWTSASESSNNKVPTILGDSILAAGFLAYLGFLESTDRTKLIETWKSLLEKSLIPFNPNISLVEYLSKPSERHQWTCNALPVDDLSMENAIILNRYIKYPLIIDPSGQANTFILNNFSEEKITKTSLSDTNFLKTLETALRFGSSLLVQDVTKMDSFLNSVLNRETHKAGGRTLITVGDSDIDFSPSFKLFLTTRDPTVEFSPEFRSRITLVNFTLTPSSLQNQCLNTLLKYERSDIDKKRSNLLRLQGEFRIRIRELEESLLRALSNVKGNILDDDQLIGMLETLKAQSEEVEREAASANLVMVEVEKVSALYLPLSEAASRIYFTLQSMSFLQSFYQFDLVFFENVFHQTLQQTEGLAVSDKGSKTEKQRLSILSKRLFKNIYTQCSVGLMNKDCLVLALELSRIYMMTECKSLWFDTELRFLLDSTDFSVFNQKNYDNYTEPVSTTEHNSDVQNVVQPNPGANCSEGNLNTDENIFCIMNEEQKTGLEVLSKVPIFHDLKSDMIERCYEWKTFLTTPKLKICSPLRQLLSDKKLFSCTENTVQPPNEEIDNGQTRQVHDSNEITQLQQECYRCVLDAIVIKMLRPDALPYVLARLPELIFSEDFTEVPPLSIEQMNTFICNHLRATIPMMLISSPGFDPGAKIVTIAQQKNHKLTSIAMGSTEGYILAQKAIESAATSGNWVLLKNVHLSSSWLLELEKLIFRLKLHENFRIFLTLELNEKVPTNFFRISFVLNFEPPVGLRASIQRTYSQFFSPSSTEQAPAVARNRLYFLLSLLHAIILERKRYIPLGWSKQYEFSDADLMCGMCLIKEWMDRCAIVPNRTETPQKKSQTFLDHIDPSSIPFDALCTLLLDVVYGGRMDNVFDYRVLSSFINHFYSKEAFESDFNITISIENQLDPTDSAPPLVAPDLSRSQKHYVDFVNTEMKPVDNPVWLGLVPQADEFISSAQGHETLQKWRILQTKSFETLKSFTTLHVHKSKSSRSLSDASSAPNVMDNATFTESDASVIKMRSRLLHILESLPPSIEPFKQSSENLMDPLIRFLSREITAINNLLHVINSSLHRLNDACGERIAFTKDIRRLRTEIESYSSPPKGWIAAAEYKIPGDINFSDWLQDFCFRLAHLARLSKDFNREGFHSDDPLLLTYQENLCRLIFKLPNETLLKENVFWLGGMYHPAAFFIATKQLAAQQLQLSLEDLTLELFIGSESNNPKEFLIAGVSLEGASWSLETNTLILRNTLVEHLPLILMRWSPKSKSKESSNSKLCVPIFLNPTRSDLVTTVHVPIQNKDKSQSSLFYQREKHHTLTSETTMQYSTSKQQLQNLNAEELKSSLLLSDMYIRRKKDTSLMYIKMETVTSVHWLRRKRIFNEGLSKSELYATEFSNLRCKCSITLQNVIEVTSIIIANDVICILTKFGASIVLDHPSFHELCRLNDPLLTDSVVRSILYNTSNDTILTIWHSYSCNYGLRISIFDRKDVKNGISKPVNRACNLQNLVVPYPGFVELEEFNGRIVTSTPHDRLFRFWNIKNYEVEFTMPNMEFREIRLSNRTVAFFREPEENLLPVRLCSVDKGDVLIDCKINLCPNKELRFLELCNTYLLIKQEDSCIRVYDVLNTSFTQIENTETFLPKAVTFFTSNNHAGSGRRFEEISTQFLAIHDNCMEICCCLKGKLIRVAPIFISPQMYLTDCVQVIQNKNLMIVYTTRHNVSDHSANECCTAPTNRKSSLMIEEKTPLKLYSNSQDVKVYQSGFSIIDLGNGQEIFFLPVFCDDTMNVIAYDALRKEILAGGRKGLHRFCTNFKSIKNLSPNASIQKEKNFKHTFNKQVVEWIKASDLFHQNLCKKPFPTPTLYPSPQTLKRSLCRFRTLTKKSAVGVHYKKHALSRYISSSHDVNNSTDTFRLANVVTPQLFHEKYENAMVEDNSYKNN